MSCGNGCGCSPCQEPLISCVPPAVVVNLNPQNGMWVSRMDITSFLGGLSTSLDSIYIAPFPLGAVLQIQINGAPNSMQSVQKVQSTAIPVDSGIIRPPDYDPVTNPYQWYVIG